MPSSAAEMFGLEQVHAPGAVADGPDGLAAFPQRTYEGTGDFADGRADGARQHERLGDVGGRGLLGEGGPDGQRELFEVGADRAREVDAYGHQLSAGRPAR
ncbi:hypothetical protein ACWCPF_44320 [Streptomyces sp. NPDC001858]